VVVPPPSASFRQRPSPPSATTSRPYPEDETRPGDSGPLSCHRCLSPITHGSLRIAVGGAHAHWFVNPHGIEFHIGCFAGAAACIGFGASSTYWSWFPGFAWQVELCAACGEHLGWVFRSADAVFHGLILDRLVEVARD
jgi:hypothetical protein